MSQQPNCRVGHGESKVFSPRSGADSPMDQFVLLTLRAKERKNMLWTLAVILLVLWALGLATAYTVGGLIHVLLVVALVVVVIQIIQGRRIA